MAAISLDVLDLQVITAAARVASAKSASELREAETVSYAVFAMAEFAARTRVTETADVAVSVRRKLADTLQMFSGGRRGGSGRITALVMELARYLGEILVYDELPLGLPTLDCLDSGVISRSHRLEALEVQAPGVIRRAVGEMQRQEIPSRVDVFELLIEQGRVVVDVARGLARLAKPKRKGLMEAFAREMAELREPYGRKHRGMRLHFLFTQEEVVHGEAWEKMRPRDRGKLLDRTGMLWVEGIVAAVPPEPAN